MSIFNILSLIGGLGLFLYGMHVMGNSLETLSGSKLEKTLEKMTSNLMKSVLVGAAVTAIIQSSSATTVMVVGFVNSGIMKLSQAIGVIMGANIGTTITSWLLSLTGIQSDSLFIQLLKPSSFTPILAIVGVFMVMMSKSSRKRELGNILLGFTVLMFGMDAMSGAVKPLADIPEFTGILTQFSNPLLGVIAGAILTAVIQSSSASVGVLQALSATGAISYGTALPIIMGQNIGTCITALLSSIGANKNAKRAALVHLYFNIIGTGLFMIVYYALDAIIHFPFAEQITNAAGIAVIHTVFNVFATLALLPFTKLLEKLAYLTIREEIEEKSDSELPVIDERFLDRPAFAIDQCRRSAHNMAKLAKDTLVMAVGLFGNYDKKVIEQIKLNEDKIDLYEDMLGTYLIQIGNKQLISRDNQAVTMILHCIGDFERIGDHAVNILEACEEMHKKEMEFSPKARQEILVFTSAITEIVSMTIDAFVQDDIDKAKQVEPLEDVIDSLQKELKKRHVKRLRKGKCTIEMGFVLSDMLTNFERIADHCSNIAICMIQISENSFDMHEYLNELKKSEDAEFLKYFNKYKEQYQLPQKKMD